MIHSDNQVGESITKMNLSIFFKHILKDEEVRNVIREPLPFHYRMDQVRLIKNGMKE